MPQQASCKWNQNHTFLLGTSDAATLKELLATKLVNVYLHDCEEFLGPDDDATFGVGQS
jgi:hypothetical protein